VTHLPFEDRQEAGRLLAYELASRLGEHSELVLGLARGGIPVAFGIADRLHLPLDVIVVRKIGVPWQPELAMGAIAGSVCILDDPLIQELGIPNYVVAETFVAEQSEMKRREELYRGHDYPQGVQGRSVILVDDGLATGSTMLAAVRHVRGLKANTITVAIPVGASDACERIQDVVDDLVCLAMPDPFYAVGRWYRNFSQLSDIDVQNLLTESRRRNPVKV
jgi:predicted phosphoribosyltransferase